jgi:hypothetical protein
LIDLWGVSDLQTRQGIVDAWAKPDTYETGGEARLLSTMETDQGLVVVVAARGLVDNHSQHQRLAKSVLRRAVEFGPADERRLALAFLPLDEEGTQALVEAQKSEDESVSVDAAARLVELPSQRKGSLLVLRQRAKSHAPGVRMAAETALARALDRSVRDALEKGLQSKDAEERRHAAVALLSLGEYSSAAPGLTDDVARVRTQVACAVLAQR